MHIVLETIGLFAIGFAVGYGIGKLYYKLKGE